MGRRLVRINLVSSCAFVIGGSLFAAGAFLAQRGEALTTVNTTYLVGGFFFSSGAYASILLVVNAKHSPGGSPPGGDAMRWWGRRPGQRDWRSSIVLFAGTLFFAVSLVAAFVRPATSTEVDAGLVNWGTFTGAVCFAIGGVIQSIDRPTPRRMVVQQSHEHTGQA